MEWSESKYNREIDKTFRKIVTQKIEGHYLIEKRWLIKSYGWEILTQPQDEVEGYKLMQDIYDRYETFRAEQIEKIRK